MTLHTLVVSNCHKLPRFLEVASRWRFKAKMWIQVRSIDGSRTTVERIRKLTKIEELREHLVEHFYTEPSRQRLFYRGKLSGEPLDRVYPYT